MNIEFYFLFFKNFIHEWYISQFSSCLLLSVPPVSPTLSQFHDFFLFIIFSHIDIDRQMQTHTCTRAHIHPCAPTCTHVLGPHLSLFRVVCGCVCLTPSGSLSLEKLILSHQTLIAYSPYLGVGPCEISSDSYCHTRWCCLYAGHV